MNEKDQELSYKIVGGDGPLAGDGNRVNDFRAIFGATYTHNDVSHNRQKETGFNWKQMQASGNVGLDQNYELFERVVSADEIMSVLDPDEQMMFDRARKYMAAVRAGELRFFKFKRKDTGFPRIFIAFMDQRENDEYNQYSKRKNPVIQENFAMLLSNPDKVWADVVQDVIRSGGFFDSDQLPPHLSSETLAANAKNRDAAMSSGDETSLSDRLASL